MHTQATHVQVLMYVQTCVHAIRVHVHMCAHVCLVSAGNIVLYVDTPPPGILPVVVRDLLSESDFTLQGTTQYRPSDDIRMHDLSRVTVPALATLMSLNIRALVHKHTDKFRLYYAHNCLQL